jgi:LmbE family N-acetylglucosaminyl deacetylase
VEIESLKSGFSYTYYRAFVVLIASHAMRSILVFLGILCAAVPELTAAQTAPKVILAIGAHAGDMELTTGALLIKQHKAGDKVVILHMTLGEGGNPKMSPSAYGAQKRREALQADSVIGAQSIFAPYKDGELPDDEAVRLYVANIIRQVKPTFVFTHWQKSIHKDHARTSRIVQDAVLLASLEGVVTGTAAHRGLRGIWYAENWEDMEDFQPYITVDVSNEMTQWRDAVTKYEFVRGGISTFRYLEYYDALATVRGAVAGKQRAISFNIDAFGKRRVLDSLP